MASTSLGTSRFSSAGLAHSAADHVTAETGIPHVMAFRPRESRYDARRDMAPFVIVPVSSLAR